MIYIALLALQATLVVAGLKDWKVRDEHGRGFFGRMENGCFNSDDLTFLKLEAACIIVAALAVLASLVFS